MADESMLPSLQPNVPATALELLRHCYLFVRDDWQHMPRNDTPDQGFEASLRQSCISKLVGWVVSQHREMNLGMRLSTASGVLHEIDIVAQRELTMGILELKNRAGLLPEKNDVIVFFSKILDYLCFTPTLVRSYLVPVFVSAYPFEQSGLAACLGLGIHPVAPGLRPLPILIDNARLMLREHDRGCRLRPGDALDFSDFCAKLNNVAGVLSVADANQRFDCYNENTLAIHASGAVDAYALADDLLALNAQSSRLVEVFKRIAAETTT